MAMSFLIRARWCGAVPVTEVRDSVRDGTAARRGGASVTMTEIRRRVT
ncbi:hypothetical protein [Rathayibacter sp. VKM Ac-2754]|nr:hypothetical protein [Rathayibacter sp. VKM Ac-2754]MWV58841.1 hypothetical protein [Rathayibacter sp. VKM Ac-2754]